MEYTNTAQLAKAWGAERTHNVKPTKYTTGRWTLDFLNKALMIVIDYGFDDGRPLATVSNGYTGKTVRLEVGGLRQMLSRIDAELLAMTADSVDADFYEYGGQRSKALYLYLAGLQNRAARYETNARMLKEFRAAWATYPPERKELTRDLCHGIESVRLEAAEKWHHYYGATTKNTVAEETKAYGLYATAEALKMQPVSVRAIREAEDGTGEEFYYKDLGQEMPVPESWDDIELTRELAFVYFDGRRYRASILLFEFATMLRFGYFNDIPNGNNLGSIDNYMHIAFNY